MTRQKIVVKRAIPGRCGANHNPKHHRKVPKVIQRKNLTADIDHSISSLCDLISTLKIGEMVNDCNGDMDVGIDGPDMSNEEPVEKEEISSKLYNVMKSSISPVAESNSVKVLNIMKDTFSKAYLSNQVPQGPLTLGKFGEIVVTNDCTCQRCGTPLKFVKTSHVYDIPMCDVACDNCGAFYEVKTCFTHQVDHRGCPIFLFNSKSIVSLVAEKDGLCNYYAGVFLVKDIDRSYFTHFCGNTESELAMDKFPTYTISFYDRESSFSTFLDNAGNILSLSEQSGSTKIAIAESV